MHTLLLLFINKHLQQGLPIERVFSEICIVGRYHDLVDPCDILISHKTEYICSSFHKSISKVVSTLLLDRDCLLDINYGVHEFTPAVLVVRVIALFQFSVLSIYELCLAMLFLLFTIFLSFYIDLLLLVTSWYSLNSFYIQI